MVANDYLVSRTSILTAAFLVFFIAILVYLRTLAPTVVLVDSGELIVAAKSLGVAHPPGFPLYVMLAHLATKLPLGNVAFRVNLASALFAALAAGFMTLLVIAALQTPVAQDPHRLRSVSQRKNRRTDKRRLEKTRARKSGQRTGTATNDEDRKNLGWFEFLPAVAAGLVLACSRTLWSFATVAEVYTLNTLLIVVTLFFLFRWRSRALQAGVRKDVSAKSDIDLLIAAGVFGLALGVHHVSVAVTLPALALLVFRTAGWSFFRSKRLLYCALISVAALLVVYAYLPLAAMRSPVMNWGDPRTLERFWAHVSGRQYQVFISFSTKQIANELVVFARLAAHEFGPFWLPLVFILASAGFVDTFRRDRTLFWFLVLLIVCDLGYSLNYEIAEDKGAYYLPAFTAVVLASGFGLNLALRLSRQMSPLRAAGAFAIALLTPLVPFAGNYAYCNRHNFFLARDYVSNIESTIAPGGLLLTGDWQVASPMLYLREVEQQRRDVIAIDVKMLRRSWYYEYLKTQYPDLIAATHEQVEAFLRDLRHWESDPDAFNVDQQLNKQINDDFYAMILTFVNSQRPTRGVYVTWDLALGLSDEDAELTQALQQQYRLVPQGLVFQVFSDREFHEPANPALELRGLNDGSFSFEEDDVVKLKVLPVYLNMMVNRGRYLQAYGRQAEAIECYRRALSLDPSFSTAREALTTPGLTNSGP